MTVCRRTCLATEGKIGDTDLHSHPTATRIVLRRCTREAVPLQVIPVVYHPPRQPTLSPLSSLRFLTFNFIPLALPDVQDDLGRPSSSYQTPSFQSYSPPRRRGRVFCRSSTSSNLNVRRVIPVAVADSFLLPFCSTTARSFCRIQRRDWSLWDGGG